MNAKAAYKRIKQFITGPTEEWQRIRKESLSAPALIGNYLVPVLLLYFICSLLGNVLFNDLPHAMSHKLFYVFGRLVFVFTAFLMSYFVINFIYRKLDINVPSDAVFTLVFYSYLMVWLVASATGLLANYKALVHFIHLFSLFGLYLFWTGSEALITPPENKRVTLYFWSFLSLAGIYYLVIIMAVKNWSTLIDIIKLLLHTQSK